MQVCGVPETLIKATFFVGRKRQRALGDQALFLIKKGLPIGKTFFMLAECLSIPQRFPFTPRVGPTRQRHIPLRILDPNNRLGAAGHVDLAHVVAFVLQRLDQCRTELSAFKFGRAVAAAEVGQVDRRLRIEVPVEQADGGFGDVFDDLRAAG
ncbi:hypothetical protein D3C85_995920 [compost metagenome]